MRNRFSDRVGATTKPTALQLEEMSGSLRTRLWNFFFKQFDPAGLSGWAPVGQQIAVEVFNTPADAVPVHQKDARKWWKIHVETDEWWLVYNLLEYIVIDFPPLTLWAVKARAMLDEANQILEQEASGYRFVGNEIAPITNREEIQEIEDALLISQKENLVGVYTHLEASKNALSAKPQPDYRNSVKESISAVEAAVKKIPGENSGGIKDALRDLSAKSDIHPAMQAAFEKLYGYTSDADGIRHPILGNPNAVGFDEAKFMLVACSAFVNFLIAKANASGLLEN